MRLPFPSKYRAALRSISLVKSWSYTKRYQYAPSIKEKAKRIGIKTLKNFFICFSISMNTFSKLYLFNETMSIVQLCSHAVGDVPFFDNGNGL